MTFGNLSYVITALFLLTLIKWVLFNVVSQGIIAKSQPHSEVKKMLGISTAAKTSQRRFIDLVGMFLTIFCNKGKG